MTPTQALEILNQATDPRHTGKLTRQDYAAIEQALLVFKQLIDKNEPAKEPALKERPDAAQ